jgi:hypothetical protein
VSFEPFPFEGEEAWIEEGYGNIPQFILPKFLKL